MRNEYADHVFTGFGLHQFGSVGTRNEAKRGRQGIQVLGGVDLSENELHLLKGKRGRYLTDLGQASLNTDHGVMVKLFRTCILSL